MSTPLSAKQAKADTKLNRYPDRGSHDFELACRLIDESRICHVGFTLDDQPYVVPMALGRQGDQLLLHGSVVSRLITNLADGLPCCVAVTHLDGLVLARSAFHSSMNYRSLMVFGRAKPVTDTDEKLRAMDALVEHLLPGRLADLRVPTRKELNATTMLRLPIEQFSIKHRSGPPNDAASDVEIPIWAGVIPLTLTEGEPIDAPDVAEGIKRPAYLF